MKGVARCVVGYSGGVEPSPTYKKIKDYTESLLIEYNPKIVSYDTLLNEWSSMHYPFISKGKRQYRSALFYTSVEQRETAVQFIDRLQKSVAPDYDRVYTDIEPVTRFFRAEEYHQNFLTKRMAEATTGRGG